MYSSLEAWKRAWEGYQLSSQLQICEHEAVNLPVLLACDVSASFKGLPTNQAYLFSVTQSIVPDRYKVN